MTTNLYTQKIINIIAPLMGQAIAIGTIKASTSKIGISEQAVGPDNIPLLASQIEKGLTIFLGTDGAKKIADQIRAIH
jgi:hypothetical protein